MYPDESSFYCRLLKGVNFVEAQISTFLAGMTLHSRETAVTDVACWLAGVLQCPPGMKQIVLQLFTRLMSRVSQPTLPHVHVHRPVQVPSSSLLT